LNQVLYLFVSLAFKQTSFLISLGRLKTMIEEYFWAIALAAALAVTPLPYAAVAAAIHGICGASSGTSPLTKAVMEGNLDEVKRSIDQNARYECGPFGGLLTRTSLFVAVKEGRADIAEIVLSTTLRNTSTIGERASITRAGLGIGPNNWIGDMSPLWMAVHNRDIKIVRLLLKFGGDPEYGKRIGFSYESLAVRCPVSTTIMGRKKL
jgi:hypothetical protein